MGLIQLKNRMEKKEAVTSGVTGGSSRERGAGWGPYLGFMKGKECRLTCGQLCIHDNTNKG